MIIVVSFEAGGPAQRSINAELFYISRSSIVALSEVDPKNDRVKLHNISVNLCTVELNGILLIRYLLSIQRRTDHTKVIKMKMIIFLVQFLL